MPFNLIPEESLPLISDYLKILIPSFITYLVTRYSLTNPRKQEIKEKQFTLVYLPLYLLTNQLLSNNKAEENLLLYIKKASKIIYKNYQFVFPKTLKLFSKLCEETNKKNINTFHIANFNYQVQADYEKLKRSLGYPTDSLFDFFKRLNRLDKLFYIAYLLFSIGIIYCAANAIILFFSKDFANALAAFFTGLILFAGLYITYYPPNH